MPIFEYRCEQCGERFEKLIRLSSADQPVTCPACSAEAKRQFSAFASIGASRSTSGAACAPSGG